MSKVLGQFLIVTVIFVIVLGGSYPKMIQAQRDELLNNYPDKMKLEENIAQHRYAAAEAHPEKLDQYIAAGDEMASVLIRQQKFDPAMEIYDKQMRLSWPVVTNAYNPRWVEVNLKLASLFRDKGDLKTAIICYNAALDLDRKYLPENDPKIARELNNIGLMHYLSALGLAEDKDRQPEFQLAIDNFKRALAMIENRGESKTATAATLWNLYLAERDIGNKAEALEYRKQARTIDDSMPRVCREP